MVREGQGDLWTGSEIATGRLDLIQAGGARTRRGLLLSVAINK